jgi:hypothetical protein
MPGARKIRVCLPHPVQKTERGGEFSFASIFGEHGAGERKKSEIPRAQKAQDQIG